MGSLEIIILGTGLSMDAAAVAMSNGMSSQRIKRIHFAAMPVFFGVFQGIMPILGYYTGTIFNDVLKKFSGIAVLLILGGIGARMIYEGIKDPLHKTSNVLSMTVLLMQSVATSIDAFAVGAAFSVMDVNIFHASLMIAITTAVIVTMTLMLGRKAGRYLGTKADILGGVILILIGIKGMF